LTTPDRILYTWQMPDPDKAPALFVQPDRSVHAVLAEFRPKDPPILKPPNKSHADWTREQYDTAVRDFFDEATVEWEARHDASLSLSYRVICAWRITRLMARLRGFLSENESLGEMDRAFWSTPGEAPANYKIPPYYSAKSRLAIHLALERQPDLGLTPPEPPAPPDLWCSLVQTIGDDILVYEGTKDYPNMGRLGFAPLIDPERAVSHWPSPDQLIAFETIVAEEALELLVKKSTASASRYLQSKYGFRWEDSTQILRLARRAAVAITQTDLEEDRAISRLRLDDLRERAADALHLQAELGAVKVQAQISGLTRFEPQDENRDIIDTIARVSAERSKRLLPEGDHP